MRMLRRAVLAALCATAALVAPGATAAPGDATLEELRVFADRFDQAQIAKNGAALEQMVSDELVFITSTGKRSDKADFIAGWTDPDIHVEPITLEDRVILPLGLDAGIAGAAVTLKGTAGGKPFASRIRFADTFRRINGEWRAVHIQVTKLP